MGEAVEGFGLGLPAPFPTLGRKVWSAPPLVNGLTATSSWNPGNEAAVAAETSAEYFRSFFKPGAIRANCDDALAAAGIGRDHDVLALWCEKAPRVTRLALDCEYLLAREAPAGAAALRRVFFLVLFLTGAAAVRLRRPAVDRVTSSRIL